MSNGGDTYPNVNTQLYCRVVSTAVVPADSGNYHGDGELQLPTDEVVECLPSFTNDVKRKYVRAGTDESTRVTNALSACFVSPDADTNYVAGSGILLKANTFRPLTNSDKYTVELFVKFDYADWKARVGDVSGKDKRVLLAWNTYTAWALDTSGKPANWELYFDLSDEANPKLAVRGYTSDGPNITAQKIIDGKWHHVAMTMDLSAYPPSSSHAEARVFFDGVASNAGSIYFYKGKSAPYDQSEVLHFWFMRGDRRGGISYANAFNGLVDEIRMTYGILAPSEFLVQKGDRGSIVIVQ